MKDFMLTDTGDVAFINEELSYVSGIDLIVQKVRTILGTNLGEWKLDAEQGIDFHVILVKNPDYDQIIDTVLAGLRQVDESFTITDYSFQTVQRHLILTFTAKMDSGDEITLSVGEAGGITGSGIRYIVCARDAETILQCGSALTMLGIAPDDSTRYRFEM